LINTISALLPLSVMGIGGVWPRGGFWPRGGIWLGAFDLDSVQLLLCVNDEHVVDLLLSRVTYHRTIVQLPRQWMIVCVRATSQPLVMMCVHDKRVGGQQRRVHSNSAARYTVSHWHTAALSRQATHSHALLPFLATVNIVQGTERPDSCSTRGWPACRLHLCFACRVQLELAS